MSGSSSAVDEAHFMADWPSGRALGAKLERDSRKWNARVLMASQDTLTALSSQKASKALISDAVIFNISASEPEQQRGALELLQVPRGHGYERTVSSLRPSDDEALVARAEVARRARAHQREGRPDPPRFQRLPRVEGTAALHP